MLAGGVEAPVTPLGLGGFGTMRALSRRNDDPEGASRPFDAQRDGFVLAEGGAVLVLEELGRAQSRGARIYAEVLGYGMSSDAHHLTEPDPTGREPGARDAKRHCRRGDRRRPDRVRERARDVHAGRRHRRDQGAQARARRGAGAAGADQLDEEQRPGHLLGAAGALESIFCVLAMRDSYVPPTINQTDPDPTCDLDYVPNTGREASRRHRALELVRVRRAQRRARAAALGRPRNPRPQPRLRAGASH